MFASILRSTMAVVLALAAAMAIIIAVEGIGAIMHPFPPGFDPTDMEACKAHVARYPTAALIMGVVGWGLAVFASAWIATRLGAGRHPAHGITIGLLLLAAAGYNMLMLPYPLWFEIANLVVFPAAFLIAAQLGRRQMVPNVPVA
ncbi:MAG: hypothetical protein SH850_10930 [Planctomycetaceae bacterium]|nr:hypothetical protein [Planctomycetaceae bacterium]